MNNTDLSRAVAKVRALQAELDAIKAQASDSTEYVLAQVNRELQDELRRRGKWHAPGCRKMIYDIASSPCTCESVFNEMCEASERTRKDATKVLTTRFKTMRNKYKARIAELEKELNDTRWDRDAAQTSAEHISKIQKDVSRLYNELLYQVGVKHPAETRHETALRYLRNAEKQSDNSAKSEVLPND